MARNCLAPAYAQVLYTSNTHDHVMRLPLNNSDDDVTHVFNRSGSIVLADTALHSYLTLVAALLAAGDEISGVEYFSQVDCLSAPIFQRSYDLGGGIAGSGGGADVPWSQIVLTFKTTLGGRFKFQLMEALYPVDQKFPLAGGVDANVDAVVASLVSGGNVVAAYDNGYPNVKLNFVSKTNDQLRKKYFNP